MCRKALPEPLTQFESLFSPLPRDVPDAQPSLVGIHVYVHVLRTMPQTFREDHPGAVNVFAAHGQLL